MIFETEETEDLQGFKDFIVSDFLSNDFNIETPFKTSNQYSIVSTKLGLIDLIEPETPPPII